MAPVKLLAPLLDRVSQAAMDYPVHLLRAGDTGVCLFAAGFLGINDAIHFARMEMPTCCVDTDTDRLSEMEALYDLPGWRFVVEDAWDFAHEARAGGETWDVVSVDSYTGHATDRSMKTLDLWCALASRVVTATIPRGQVYHVPAGWDAAVYPRSPIADWLVLTRA